MKKTKTLDHYECCESGCAPCVFDTYDQDMQVYEQKVSELKVCCFIEE